MDSISTLEKKGSDYHIHHNIKGVKNPFVAKGKDAKEYEEISRNDLSGVDDQAIITWMKTK